MAVRVGDVGWAVTPLKPSGYVDISGVRYGARSDGAFVEPGTRCVVVRGDPTGLVVRGLDPGRPPPTLPGHGEEVRGPEAVFTATAGEVRTAEPLPWRQRLAAGAIAAGSLGGAVGLAAAAAGLIFGWVGHVGPGTGAVILAAGAAAGIVWAAALFFATGAISAAVGAVTGSREFAPSIVVVFAALLGTAVGYWWEYAPGSPGVAVVGALAGAAVGTAAGYLVRWLTELAV
jgi:hypothetical protein